MCRGNEYLENVVLSLVDFESDIIAALDEAQNIEDFNLLLRARLEAESVSQELKSATTTEIGTEKDSLILVTMNEFKSSIYYGYDESLEAGSKTEFMNYLDFRKTEFIDNIDNLEFIKTQQDKDILIALMNFEIGMFETMIEYSDEVIALGNNSYSSPDLKSASGYTWWQRVKKYTQCVLVSQATVAGFLIMISGIPVVDILGAVIVCGASLIVIECWTDYLENYI